MPRRWLLVAVALAQNPGAEWRATPLRPTVGDTVWLERRFALPAGWRVRPGRIDGGEVVESLGDPTVSRTTDGWAVRYPVTAWKPGVHTVAIPPVWRLGPDAQADSVLGGAATFALQSVIPDTLTSPAPRPALDPLRVQRRDVRPVLLAVLVATMSLAAALWWRRRPPRQMPEPSSRVVKPEIADARWLEAGEARAVAARAAARLRVALAGAVKDAHLGLSTAECLAVAQQARPRAYAELAMVLGALDQVAFATRPNVNVVQLADRARALAGALER